MRADITRSNLEKIEENDLAASVRQCLKVHAKWGCVANAPKEKSCAEGHDDSICRIHGGLSQVLDSPTRIAQGLKRRVGCGSGLLSLSNFDMT